MQELIDRRTKKSKRYLIEVLPDGRKRYALRASVGSLHYKDAVGQWQDIDLTAEEPDAEFSIKWTKLPYLVRMAGDSRRRIYPDRNDLSYWVEVGKPFANMGTPTQTNNRFIWDFNRATVGIVIGREAVKFLFTLKDNKAPTSITFPFSVQGITRQGDQLLHNGEIVAELRRPIAIDANGVERDVNVSWGVGAITLSLDTTGLAFPIEIDPTFTVGTGEDDDYVRRAVAYWTNTSPNVIVGNYDTSNYGYGGSMRFTGVNIPGGATKVDIAYLILICSLALSGTTVRTDLCCENSNNPGQIANYGDHIGRTRTTAVAWDGIGAWTLGQTYNSDDFASAVQEVVDDNSGTGDALIVFWEDKNKESDVGATRRAASKNNTTYNPPQIYLEWTENGGGGGAETLGWII